MKFKILLFMTFMPWIASAEVACLEVNKSSFSDLEKVAEAVEDECPNARPLRGICDHVMSPEDMDGERSHIFKLKKAACVLKSDSPEEEGRKIREMWTKFEDKLTCDTIAFSIRGANIIKATVRASNKDFIYQVIEWKVNLNRIDIDKRTVLDYISDELKKGQPPQTTMFLEKYYGVLKRNGAKHSSEL